MGRRFVYYKRYNEFRSRIFGNAGKGSVFREGRIPAFWLVSLNAVLAHRDPSYKKPEYRIEIDIFENFSSKNGLVPNIHKYENVPGGRHCRLIGIDQGASKNGTRTFRFPDSIDPNDWHTYGFLWTVSFITPMIFVKISDRSAGRRDSISL